MPHVHLCRTPRTDFTELPPWRPRVERVLHGSGVGWRENCLELAIPIPHHTSSHPRPLPCTTFSTRGTMRPCLEPTVPVPILHHTSSHATPCHAHTQPSLLAAPFAPSSSRQLRTPMRPFIEATITKLRASTLSCHPCSPVGSHAQCILRPPPRQLPSCPVRLSQHHSPLPRGNCPDPPHQHLLMPLRHPDALPTCPAPSLAAPCAPAFPGQPHQRLSQPPTSARSPRLSGQLSYTTHPQMAARSAPQLPRSSLTAPRALASS